MPRFDFKMDLVVADAQLFDGTPIRVAVLVMLGPDGTVAWQSDKAYPLQTWTLENVARDVQDLREVAVEHWPELAGACDWWVPEKSHWDVQRAAQGQEDGTALGMQDG